MKVHSHAVVLPQEPDSEALCSPSSVQEVIGPVGFAAFVPDPGQQWLHLKVTAER